MLENVSKINRKKKMVIDGPSKQAKDLASVSCSNVCRSLLGS